MRVELANVASIAECYGRSGGTLVACKMTPGALHKATEFDELHGIRVVLIDSTPQHLQLRLCKLLLRDPKLAAHNSLELAIRQQARAVTVHRSEQPQPRGRHVSGIVRSKPLAKDHGKVPLCVVI